MAQAPEFVHLVKDMLLKHVVSIGDNNDRITNRNITVTIHYVGALLDGTIFDSSIDRDKPFQFMLGLLSADKFFEAAVSSMCVGEKSIFVIHPCLAYGHAGSGCIPTNAVVRYEIELLEAVEEDWEFPISPADRLTAAKVRRELGKKLFNEGRIPRALKKYERGAELLEFIDGELAVECANVRAFLLANACLCHLKLN